MSHSGRWVKVELVDEDGEESILSFSKNFVDIVASDASSSSKSSSNRSTHSETERSLELEAYPGENGESVSSAAAGRALGLGEGLTSGEGAAELTQLVLKHELNLLRESVC